MHAFFLKQTNNYLSERIDSAEIDTSLVLPAVSENKQNLAKSRCYLLYTIASPIILVYMQRFINSRQLALETIRYKWMATIRMSSSTARCRCKHAMTSFYYYGSLYYCSIRCRVTLRYIGESRARNRSLSHLTGNILRRGHGNASVVRWHRRHGRTQKCRQRGRVNYDRLAATVLRKYWATTALRTNIRGNAVALYRMCLNVTTPSPASFLSVLSKYRMLSMTAWWLNNALFTELIIPTAAGSDGLILANRTGWRKITKKNNNDNAICTAVRK